MGLVACGESLGMRLVACGESLGMRPVYKKDGTVHHNVCRSMCITAYVVCRNHNYTRH